MNAPAQPMLQIERLRKYFPVGTSGIHFGRAKIVHQLHAVDDVSFTIAAGESVGLVGESGCGKSTLVRLLARLADPTAGGIRFEGRSIEQTPAARFARSPDRALIQMVFQDPTDSLNPRFTAFDAIAEPLRRPRPRRTRQDCGSASTTLPGRWDCRRSCCRASRTNSRADRKPGWALRAPLRCGPSC